ncbi:MAG: DEAD/DEAH box helicase [Candidatus Cloacimonetes bacterium]|nr:DEAD/DEAH box helicase [Candidatus Cloacimonadota bacterium]
MSLIKNYLTQSGYGYYNEYEFNKNFSFSYIELEQEYFLFLYQLKNSTQYDYVLLMLDVATNDKIPTWFGRDLSKKVSRDQCIRAASYVFVHSNLCQWDISAPEIQAVYNLAHQSIQTQSRLNSDFLYMVDHYQYSNLNENVEIHVENIIEKPKQAIHDEVITQFELSSHGFQVNKLPDKKNAKLALCINEKGEVKGLLQNEDKKLFALSAKQLEKYNISNISGGLQSLWENHFTSVQSKSYLKIKSEQFQYLIRHLLIEILDELDDKLIYFESGSKKVSCQKLDAFKLHLSFCPSKESNEFFDINCHFRGLKFNKDKPLLSFQTNKNNFLFIPLSQSCLFIKRTRNSLEDNFFSFISHYQAYPASTFSSIQSSLQTLDLDFLTFDTEISSRYFVKLNPIAKLVLYDLNKHKELFLNLNFDYDEALTLYLKQSELKGEVNTLDNPEFESLAKYYFLQQTQAQFSPIPTRKLKQNFHYSINSNDIPHFYQELAPKLLERGFSIYSLNHKKKLSNNLNCKLHLELNPEEKWLHFKVKIDSKNQLLNIDSFDLAEGYACDQDGIMHYLNAQDIEQLAKLKDHFEDLSSDIKLPLNPLLIKEILTDDNYESLQVKTYLDARKTILNIKNKSNENPIGLDTNLRPYQIEGFQFLRAAHNSDYGVLLADDMGLGKTIQSLALLSTLHARKQHNQTLIVAPVSAITNWQREINKFCPQLSSYAHMGTNREFNSATDIILVSYTTLRIDLHLFKSTTFTCLILDESQMIKNPSSLQSKAVKEISATQRIALSGTPLENNTLELWSLFDFLNPNFLGTRKWFRTNFSIPIEVGKVEAKARTLKTLISPMVLRRNKEVVSAELPSKTENNITLQMSDDQLTAYHITAKFYREKIKNHFDAIGVDGAGPLVLTGMMRLRQTCLLPELANKEFLDVSACKIDYLREVLPKIIENGHKILIFSQFIGVLDKLKSLMQELLIEYSHFDGSTNRKLRQEQIDRFHEEPDRKVFLISLKSGGTALNLVAADYVFLMDPWWNPAVENQAIDRSHRIGQTKSVFVYRLIVEKTIEEKIQKLQKDKRDLSDKLFIDSNLPNFKDPKDLLNFFEEIE